MEPRGRRRFGGALILLAVCGSGAAGYLLGRSGAAGEDAPRPRAVSRASEEAPGYRPYSAEWEAFREEAGAPPPPPSPGSAEGGDAPAAVAPGELAAALARDPGSPYAQKMLDAFVAEAARRGPAMLPEIEALLAAGTDVTLAAFAEDGRGYPTLRLALLDAAAATGDPAATLLLGEVARTSASPMEVLFSAHLLDRLESLDAESGRRALDALSAPLSEEQRRALGPVLRQVVPAAARADPDYAEAFLHAQLRPGEGPRTEPRLVVPALDGIPPEQARRVVLASLTSPEVADRAKAALASHAAGSMDLAALGAVRHAIETRAVPPKVAGQAARAALFSPAFGRLERDLRKALKAGDFAGAERLGKEYAFRISEAERTVAAARAVGSDLPAELEKQASILAERAARAAQQVARERAKQEKARVR
ncbi:MAG: hypothetical protein ACT4PV_10010 [Planctomycetaceae bacterium]